MLSYLHGFHAGNHADVLKHVLLVRILDTLTAKGKPLRYVETHAGAGGYDLRAANAQRNREHVHGIGRLWTADDAPAAVARWRDLVRDYNGAPADLTRYPGSPWLARKCLRSTDSLCLFELHPAEHKILVHACAADERVRVLREDGLRGAIGLVPPPERRGLVFVDPSYELRDEHRLVVDALAKAHRRFATGVFAVWYPVVERRWVDRFTRALRDTGIAPLHQYELTVSAAAPGRGLTGSGMLVVNPPWQLREAMQDALPWLARKLASTRGSGGHRIVA
jgi:23S rRNA (adenine2030-N6)-methyltransferase